MKFFGNKKTVKGNKAADTAAGWIAARIQNIQTLWAKGMSKLFARLSPASTKVIVICCAALTVSYSTILVAAAFSRPDRSLVNPAAFVKMRQAFKTAHVRVELPEKLPVRIQKLRRYLDSLATTEAGRHQRDSLFKQRPGLLDSLRQIENIYCR